MTEVYNTNVAFQVVFPVTILTKGEVEFKYRKDSRASAQG